MQLMKNKWASSSPKRKKLPPGKTVASERILNHFNINFLLFQLGLVVFLTSVSVSSPTTFPGMEMSGFSPGETIFKESTDARDIDKHLKSSSGQQSITNPKDYYYSSLTTKTLVEDQPIISPSKFAIDGQFPQSTTTNHPPTVNVPKNYINQNNEDGNKFPLTIPGDNDDITSHSLSSTPNTPFRSFTTIFTSERPGNENINLHRKLQLWSSGRSAKLNLTHEHETLLRIEPKPRNNTRRFSSFGEISEFLLSSSSTSSTNSVSTQTTTTFLKTSLSSQTTSPTSKINLEPISPTQASSISKFDDDRVHVPILSSNPIKSRSLIGEEEEEGEEAVQTKGSMTIYPSEKHISQAEYKSGYTPDWLAHNNGRHLQNNAHTNGTIDYYTESLDSNDNSRNSNRKDAFFIPQFERRRNFGGGDEDEEDSPEREMSERILQDVEHNNNRSKTRIDENSFPSLDNGLADVISRGRIDSVMYVYFGDKYNDDHKEEIAGRVIQAVGCVVAAIAQILTVLGATKCIRKGNLSNRLPIHIHVGFALLISNLLLLLAVHATEPLDVCASVAVVLHYLHLVIGCWFLAHTIQTYKTLRRYVDTPNHLLTLDVDQQQQSFANGDHLSFLAQKTISSTTFRYCAITWAAPFPFILVTYLTSPEGYETQRFCWMSIERGMLVSFIVPIFLLIGLNTVLVILSLRYILALRKLWLDPSCGELEEDLSDGSKTISNSVIRASTVLLPLLAVMWFLGVVALENPTSIFFQLAAAVANIALSWLVMYFVGDEVWSERWCSFFNNSNSNLSSSIEEEEEGGREGSIGSVSSIQPSGTIQFDNEPLLSSPSAATSSQIAVAGPSTSNNNNNNASSSSGPSNSSKCSILGGRRSFYKSRPNWSRPGPNEIYELRHGDISTICK